MKSTVLHVLSGLLIAATPALPHHKISDYYDVTKPITLKGAVRSFVRANPHSFILMDVKNAAGNVETWAIEGDGDDNWITAGWDMRSSGWNLTARLQPGDEITVTALPAKAGVNIAGAVGIDESKMRAELVIALKQVAERARAGRVAHGIDVTLRDGRKLLFGESGR